jgi:heterodisulfide reductase subunit B
MAGELPKYECSIDGCDQTVEFPYLMCPRHWRRVSKVMQEAAWQALEARNLRLHRKIGREAIAEVNTKFTTSG